MKICLVTAFPPSRRGLNEYGFHLARELQRDPLLSLTVLADQLEELLGEVVPDAARARAPGIASRLEGRFEAELAKLRAFNDPIGIYARLPLDLAVH